MMPELKPCPFCGGEARYANKRVPYRYMDGGRAPGKMLLIYVECVECRSRSDEIGMGEMFRYPGLNKRTKEGVEKRVADAWNRRANDEQ